jgi:hypothetical protein
VLQLDRVAVDIVLRHLVLAHHVVAGRAVGVGVRVAKVQRLALAAAVVDGAAAAVAVVAVAVAASVVVAAAVAVVVAATVIVAAAVAVGIAAAIVAARIAAVVAASVIIAASVVVAAGAEGWRGGESGPGRGGTGCRPQQLPFTGEWTSSKRGKSKRSVVREKQNGVQGSKRSKGKGHEGDGVARGGDHLRGRASLTNRRRPGVAVQRCWGGRRTGKMQRGVVVQGQGARSPIPTRSEQSAWSTTSSPPSRSHEEKIFFLINV